MEKYDGLRLTEVLQLIFIVLKLLKLINWSWWVVFTPTFINIGIILLCFLIYGIIEFIKQR